MTAGPSVTAGTVDAKPPAWAWLLLALAVLVHAWGLDGQSIPRNGDEMVYAHIARATAQSGHWLPLASELGEMRNTKPPVLFWQAMVATDWGREWTLLRLRLPSLLYTLAVAGMCAAIAFGASRRRTSAVLAATLYLAFFSTFRYGRPYLTSAPETFWLNLPMLWLAWRLARGGAASPGWGLSVLLGLAVGLGTAYKSFAMAVPALGAFWLALLATLPARGWRDVLAVTVRCTLAGGVAIAVFALWFVLDPDPVAVWREFVVGENAGKLGRDVGYLRHALWGGESVWAQLLAYAQNAGLLAPLVAGLAVLGVGGWRRQAAAGGWRARWAGVDPWHRMLLCWLLVWLLIFCLPSVRSARYVIPAMPALAVLLALGWNRLGRGWALCSAVLSAILLLAMARIGWATVDVGLARPGEAAVVALAVLAGLACVLAAFARPRATWGASLAASLWVYAAFNAVVAPLDGPAGRFEGADASRIARVQVPSNFRASWEQYRFLLPAARVEGYAPPARDAAPAALQQHLAGLGKDDALVWFDLQGSGAAPCSPTACRVLAQRWAVHTRHQKGEVSLRNVWRPQEWLLRREWLLAPASAGGSGG